jgi:chromosome partitioning protein
VNWRRRDRGPAPPVDRAPDGDDRPQGGGAGVQPDLGMSGSPPEAAGSLEDSDASRDDTDASQGAATGTSSEDALVSPPEPVPTPRPLPREELAPLQDAAPTAPTRPGAVVMAVTNQKGGVGKTTTTVSLGAALAAEDLDVLVIDLDPQGNATTGLGLRVSQGAPSTYRVIVEQMPLEDAAEPTAVRRLHIVPSSLDLAGAEIELVPQYSRERRLADAVDAVRDQYDVVLIDCPPSLGLLTVNALVASDQVLVPIQCEYYALEGLGQLMRTIDMVRDGLNSRLHLGGVLMTMYDARTNLSQQVVDEVRGHFGDLAYTTVIPRTVRLSEAPSFGQPITEFDPTSRGARSYQRLAQEVARRLGLAAGPPTVSALDGLLGAPADPESTAPDREVGVTGGDVSEEPGIPPLGAPQGDTGNQAEAAPDDDPEASTLGSGASVNPDDAMFHVDPSTGLSQEGQTWRT